ncbi:type II toxin-antitoxin system Phd/YefM family antitoxin [Conexibacter woesei]|uniref:Antitoxin n=1 Tax=Conexibacter woesei (strain DSM 14684 / CCUG 47730 / CIP 108061 / JCM 11494 / NBRC 100937 / ID131577) TaxID=469383 RepID=D3FBX0_CONWI|nr:type II toxin-antitoxin system prevent-host-death family antitoxin [Conexibacter woesei]ADB51385.1 prevent-host-death family protein [Conexibacter woesei DSM 14684]
MRSIGIRELRQQASRYLREVERGETFEVTDRGRPVALLAPVPQASTVERLAASGRLRRASGDVLALGEPLAPAAGISTPSETLERLRDDER